MKLKISIALLIALTPALAQAKPRSGGTHMRPQLFHDRTPKARPRDSRLHEVRMPAPKSPPPAAVKEEY
jgi:hypothetical protein